MPVLKQFSRHEDVNERMLYSRFRQLPNILSGVFAAHHLRRKGL